MPLFTFRSLLVLLAFGLILFGDRADAQDVTIHGTVYNMYRTRPLDGVSVVCTSGRGTTTDSSGNYVITVRPEDSIYFSYLGRSTTKYPVSTINSFTNFDIALHVDPITLKEIRVMPKNYKMDSIQNRKDYARIFDYKKPGFKITSPGTSGLGVGVDLDELINMLRFQKIRRTLAFQRRLEDEEKEKFVDHRFSRYIVKKVTHMSEEELDTFMISYRPSYLFCAMATDYDFLDYIKLAYAEYKRGLAPRPGEMKKP
ncbi:MAG: carboxypeptidase-like regulatory domain-containing protein [Bacteroidota bacterium]|nr:carboxypeptidase-like regulatory domain-containing protein [Bacteroidota bacterium]